MPASASDTDEEGTATREREIPPWVEELRDSLTSGLAEVHRILENRQSLDHYKEEQISRLHDELQAYKTDHLERVKLPLLSGLIRLHDDLGKVVASLRNRPPEELTPERFFSELAGFADDLELLLGQHGVEPFRLPDEAFDPQRQTALRTEATDDAERVGCVAAHLRPGFQKEEKILQKERVVVYAAAAEGGEP